MKKSVIVALLVSLMFRVACTEKVSDEKVKADISELSDEKLDSVINDAKSGDAALAGQATMIERGFFWRGKVSARKVLEISQDVKIERLEEKILKLQDQAGTGTLTGSGGNRKSN